MGEPVFGRQRRAIPPSEVAEMVRLYVMEEWSLADVGAMFDRDASTVRSVLRRHDVKIRDQQTGFRMFREARLAEERSAIASLGIHLETG